MEKKEELLTGTQIQKILKDGVERTRETLEHLKREGALRRQRDLESIERLKRLDNIISGTTAKGLSGENILHEIFKQFPEDMIVTNFSVHGKIRTTRGRSVKISSHKKEVEHTIRFEDLPEKERQDLLEELEELGISFEEISRPDNIGNQVRLKHYVRALHYMKEEIKRIRAEVEAQDEGYYFQDSLFGF